MENKVVSGKLDGFIQIGRCFKERLIKIRALGPENHGDIACVHEVVGDVGT
jgi:hypothetical protein